MACSVARLDGMIGEMRDVTADHPRTLDGTFDRRFDGMFTRMPNGMSNGRFGGMSKGMSDRKFHGPECS